MDDDGNDELDWSGVDEAENAENERELEEERDLLYEQEHTPQQRNLIAAIFGLWFLGFFDNLRH